MTKNFISLFSCPKPFTAPHIAVIQRNAIRTWTCLDPQVDVCLVGDEDGVADVAAEFCVRHLAGVGRNASGTPLISSIFEMARRQSHAPLLLYVNADILLFNDIVAAARQLVQLSDKFLAVGQRWDLNVQESLNFSSGWEEMLRMRIMQEGRLHPPRGSDYFIFPRECFSTIPDFALGRAGWDNWMIYHARQERWLTVNATPSVTVVHQHHDYSHLPGGRSHYRLPESDENTRLAGGYMRTRFTLEDANYLLKNGRLVRERFSFRRFLRNVEVFPLLYLHSHRLSMTLAGCFNQFFSHSELKRSRKKIAR